MNWIKVNNEDESALPPLEKVVAIIFVNDYNYKQVFALGGRGDVGEGWAWVINDSRSYTKDQQYSELVDDDDYHVTHWAEIQWPED